MDAINKRVLEHYETYKTPGFIMIGLQGSQNYGLATEHSDVDTKMLVTPSFSDFIKNRKAVSVTKIMPNDEHCDVKDVRLYWECLRKQNINFVELLFTSWYFVNPEYREPWGKLLQARESIARYDTHAAIKCMKGMAFEKLKALDHPYPSKLEVLDKFGYDPKQLHHILRIRYFMEDYIDGLPYIMCLRSKHREYLTRLKLDGAGMSAETAKRRAESLVEYISELADWYRESYDYHKDEFAEEVLDTTLEEILTIKFKQELLERE